MSRARGPQGARQVRWVDKLTSLGAAAQASVPGLCAWAITVAPYAWAKNAPAGSKAAAIGGLAALATGALGERRWVGARLGSLWGFVVGSAVVWALAPPGADPVRFDSLWALSGFLGWALFALATAAPAVAVGPEGESPDGTEVQREASSATDADGDEAPRPRRRPLAALDWVCLLMALAYAVLLECIGWRTAHHERELLVRLIALVAGLALVHAGTQAALSRRTSLRQRASAGRGLRDAAVSLLLLGVLAVGGLLWMFR
jgi:hypothetical protein